MFGLFDDSKRTGNKVDLSKVLRIGPVMDYGDGNGSFYNIQLINGTLKMFIDNDPSSRSVLNISHDSLDLALKEFRQEGNK